MKVLNKIGNIVMNILIGIVSICLIFAVYNFIQLNIFKKSYTNYFGYTYFEILTGSMKDEIEISDYVFVKITKNISENDIISFYLDNSVITHRVLEINGDKIVTKGDANNAVDDEISYDDVIGKVVYVGHDFGKYMKIITEPIVFIPFFIAIALFNLAILRDDEGKDNNEEIQK